jgi:hypothetical protein
MIRNDVRFATERNAVRFGNGEGLEQRSGPVLEAGTHDDVPDALVHERAGGRAREDLRPVVVPHPK